MTFRRADAHPPAGRHPALALSGFLVLGVLALLPCPAAFAATLHLVSRSAEHRVAPIASSTAGTSEAEDVATASRARRQKPRKRLFFDPAAAFAALRPGDTLLIGPGVYRWGGDVHLPGTAEAPIIIAAKEPGRAIFDGSSEHPALVWKPTRVAHVWRASWRGSEPAAAVGAGQFAPIARVLVAGDCRDRRPCWAFDTHSNEVFVRLPKDERPDATNILFSHRPHGLQLVVRKRRRSGHVTIRGLVFRHFARAAVRAVSATSIGLQSVEIRSCGQGFVAYDSPRASVVDSALLGFSAPLHENPGAILFSGRSPNGRVANSLIVDARQAAVRGHGLTHGADVRDNLIVGSPLPWFFKASGYPAHAHGNVAVGGRVLSWHPHVALGPENPANILIGVAVQGDRALADTRCKVRSRCARTGLAGASRRLSVTPRRYVAAATAAAAQPDAFRETLLPRNSSQTPTASGRASQSGRSARTGRSELQPRRRATLWVSPTGDDKNDGRSSTTAWRSLDRAASAARPGDTVRLQPGVHHGELVPPRSGAPSAPIVFAGDPGGRTVLDAQRIGRYLVRLHGVHHIELRDLSFVGVHNIPQGAVLLDGAHDIVVDRCLFDLRNGLGAGVHARYNTENTLAVTNSVFVQAWWGIRWYFGHLVAENNVFDTGVSGGVQLFRRRGTASVRFNAITSAVAHKRHAFGALFAVPDVAAVQSDYNVWIARPDDPYQQLVGLRGSRVQGQPGLREWQQFSGHDRRSRLLETETTPLFVGRPPNAPIPAGSQRRPANAVLKRRDWLPTRNSPLRAVSDGTRHAGLLH